MITDAQEENQEPDTEQNSFGKDKRQKGEPDAENTNLR